MADQLLQGLDTTQTEAVTSESQPLAILAGAGSGKTRVLTRRIAWRAQNKNLDTKHTVAVTFTRKAANELTSRLSQLNIAPGITTGTFHSIAYAQLHKRWAEREIRPPQLLDRKIGFIANLLPRGDRSLPLDATSELEWISARALTAETYPVAASLAGRVPPLPMPQMIELIERYADEKRRRRLVDFDDLLHLSIRDLKDEEYAARIQTKFQHFFVDEFQDINPLQFNLLKSWLGDRQDLCVVGDPNQAIYGWNGADASYLRWFNDRFSGGETIQLGHNYRSTPEIVKAGHSVLPSNVRNTKPPEAHLPSSAKPTVSTFPDDRSEAAGAARKALEEYKNGVEWGEQAILVRTNAQTIIIAEQCRANKVPVSIKGGTKLTNQAEVKQLLSIMQRSGDLLSDSLDAIKTEIEDNSPPVVSPSTAEVDRHTNRLTLLRLVTDHLEADETSSTSSFIEWFSSTASGDDAASNNAVQVMTFHSAKGLEWEAVQILGIEQGLIPIGFADTPAELAEERRLLHVGITRAKQKLHLSWAQERQFGDKSARRTRSPYLDVIDPSAKKLASKKVTVRDTKKDLPVDDPTYIALVAWRKETAEENSIPAFLVFNNRTLAAIVKMQPKNEAELLEVPGVGPAKIEKYAEEVLELLND